MSTAGLLSDVRVLSASGDEAVRFCAGILARLGAEVCDHGDPDEFEVVLTGTDVPDGRSSRGIAARRKTLRVSITPYGLWGPYVLAPDGAPPAERFGLGTAPVVALAGSHAAVAALAGLRAMRRGATGVSVEVASLEVLAGCLGDALPAALCRDRPGAAPHADRRPLVLPCADGYVQITVPTVADRYHLAALTGMDALADPDCDAAPLLANWLRSRTRAQVFDEAQLWRLPITPVLTPNEVPEFGPAADAGRTEIVRPPFHYREGPAAAPVPRRRCHRAVPLGDVRVLDFGMVWAGPYCGRLLAHLGAEVIKVEGPTRVDGTRGGESARCRGLFADLNHGKAGLAIDLTDPSGRDALLRLVRRADVVLENFSPRVMANLGLDEAVLWRANPRLVGLSLPAFGRGGPWANRVAYGSGIEAVAGLAVRDAGPPRLSAVPYTDFLAGCYGAAALLAALLRRDRDGRSGWMEVPQHEVARDVLSAAPRAVGAKPVWDAALLLADPHLGARGLFTSRPGNRCPGRHYARPPFLLHGIPSVRQRSAPDLGADSRRLLIGLAGIPAGDVDRLAARGIAVVSGAPRRGA